MGYLAATKNKHITTDKEDRYSSAFVVTLANAANLQSLLDTHGTVRLEAGDYSGSGPIIMTSNQAIYGWHFYSNIGGNITISAGSSNVYLESIKCSDDLIFEAGAEITNCTFKYMRNTRFILNNGRLANCLFIDARRCRPLFDCSISGYFRNNIFIKMTTQNIHPQTIMYANDDEISYSNIELWRNFLFSNGDGGEYRDLYNHTIVGMDAETWNNTDSGVLGLIHARRIHTLMLSGLNAYNNKVTDTLPAFDIQAKKVIFSSTRIEDNPANRSFIRTGTDYATIYSRNDFLEVDSPTSTLSLSTLNQFDNEVLVNGTNVVAPLTDPLLSNVKGLLDTLEGERIEFDKEEYQIRVSEVGWKTRRIGQADQSSFIQNLINTEDIAVLEAGTYYISQPLLIEKGKGIKGAGMTKTVIIGITDDFPLLQHIENVSTGPVTSVDYVLVDVTFQGGNAGLYISSTGENNLQLTFVTIKNVTFRDQIYGWHFKEFYGFDNNFIENLTFENCTIGLFQDPDPLWDGTDDPKMMYIDKTVFYNCKFINCGTAFDMIAKRVNNTNMWLNCHFYRNGVAMNINNVWNDLYVNCIFEETSGSTVIDGNTQDIISFYGCTFRNNSVTNLIHLAKVYMEDCHMEDNVPIIEGGGNRVLALTNCTIAGTLGDVDHGMLYDTTVVGNTTLSKKVVSIIGGVPTVIVDELAVPTPKILIKIIPPTITKTVTTYDYTDASFATKWAYQTAVNADITVGFPTDASFAFIPTAQENLKINRTNSSSPSSYQSGTLIDPPALIPPATNHYYLYAEGSGLVDNGDADQHRFCILLPSSYNGDNGIKLSAQVSLSRVASLDTRIRVYYRPTGGNENDWIFADIAPANTGIREWQDWDTYINSNGAVDIMFTIQNDGRTGVWPDKNFIDSGIADVVINGTTFV